MSGRVGSRSPPESCDHGQRMTTLNTTDLVVVTGAGGFIGGHLVSELRHRGHTRIRAVDYKPFEEWYQRFEDVDNRVLDLREAQACETAAREARYIFNLAADMG